MKDDNFNNDRDNPYIIRDESLEPDFSSIVDDDDLIAEGAITGGSDEPDTVSTTSDDTSDDGADSSQTNTENAEVVTEEAAQEPRDRSADNSNEKEKNDIGSDIIRGHINTIILRALYERDKYGYEIMSDIEQKSHGQYSLKQPTLYSALKRLENQGYIKAYWKTDEVSNGGRRKYFTLTESGKEITEKNLAEWEYSRTIIDSLISDRAFDFSQPAPTPVDFTILRNSVSRVPVIKSDEEGRDDHSEEEQHNISADKHDDVETADECEVIPEHTVLTESVQPAQNTNEQVVEEIIETEEITTQESEKPAEQPQIIERVIIERVVEQQPAEQTPIQEYDPQPTQQYAPPAPPPVQTIDVAAQAEARRIAHENYLKLISEPIRVQPQVEDIVPNSDKVNTDSLIYNNRPETERDYKNLIDGIFRKAISNGSMQYAKVEPPKPVPEVTHVRLVDRGRADGVKVATSNSFDSESTYATKTTYDKGKTFLKCSAVVLAITIIEFIACIIFLGQLNTTWAYPVVILSLGVIQFAVFGVMALQGYGKNCVRPTSNSYISSCVILTIIAILIISALSFLLNMNPTSASDVIKMIVIPSITALNVVVFAVSFKAFIK